MKSISKFWNEFCQKNKIAPNALEGAYAFGANSHDADVLSDLINRGIKTATTSIYISADDVPVVGMYSIVLDGNNQPVCVIKNETVEIMPFKNVSEKHAYLEGEGDRSYESWRKVHEAFFTWECKEELGKKFTEDTEVVCETFTKVG